MSLLEVNHVTFDFGGRVILKDASFRLLKGEHIGLVGANGEGKSTFIKLLMGELLPEEGTISWAKHLKIGYLDQFSVLEKGKTIHDILATAFDWLFEIEKNINDDYEKMGDMSEEELNATMEDIGEMQSLLEHSGFYEIDVKINEVASGLGLLDLGLNRFVDELSGGQRAKILLAKLLLQNPQILILDEPTNYLDEDHIEWLKSYLNNFENAFILISHDVAFLNQTVSIIYHLNMGEFTRYTGNYDAFTASYEMKKQQIEKAYVSQQKEIQHMEDFIARNKARVATRSMANSRQKKLDKMVLVEKASEKIKPNFSFPMGKMTGKVILEAHDVVTGYDHHLSKPFDITLLKGEKVAICGANGIGKTTFIRSILNQIKLLGGSIWLSPAIEIGYFEQEAPDNRKTPFEEIQDSYPKLNNGEIHYYLSACGLSADNIISQIITLSGGEEAKLRLAKLMIVPSNLLIFDEPTNHLDPLAKDSLKDAMKAYPGTILFVSHEPEFYEKVATRIVNLEEYSLK
jgi:ATPase subunit of ABC transporter with duplicated ATPase domains